MKKKIKIATIVAGVGTVLLFAGCGGSSPEEEYTSLINKSVEAGAIGKSGAEKELQKFKSMTPEQQKKAIEEAKFWLECK